jgi:hypothetical protein
MTTLRITFFLNKAVSIRAVSIAIKNTTYGIVTVSITIKKHCTPNDSIKKALSIKTLSIKTFHTDIQHNDRQHKNVMKHSA